MVKLDNDGSIDATDVEPRADFTGDVVVVSVRARTFAIVVQDSVSCTDPDWFAIADSQRPFSCTLR